MALDTNQTNSIDFLFKYIFFGMIQFSAIMMMFTTSLEILGIIFSLIVAIFISVISIIDFSNYRLKYFDFISVFIYFALMSIILSSALLFKTMTKLQYQYKTQKANIEFTRNARKNVDKFKKIFVSLFVAIPLLFLVSDINANNPSTTYFSEPSTLNPITWLLYLLKSVFPFGILTGCGYLLYLSIELFKLNAGQLYVEPKRETTVPKPAFMNGLFNNVNLGFLANVKTQVI